MCSVMIIELWPRKRETENEEENDVEDPSGYEKSVVQLARLGWEDLVSV